MPESGVRLTIANGIGRLQSEYYGRGPVKAKTYLTGDLVVVALEETLRRPRRR